MEYIPEKMEKVYTEPNENLLPGPEGPKNQQTPLPAYGALEASPGLCGIAGRTE
jgi:hypothetical protein